MRLPLLLAVLAPTFAVSGAWGAPSQGKPCRIGSISSETGGGLQDRTLARDSTYCRRLEKIWPDFVALVRAAGLDAKRHGLFFLADDGGPANAVFLPPTGSVGVNGAMLSLPTYDRNMLRGILAHELGHAVQHARGVEILGAQKPVESGTGEASPAAKRTRALKMYRRQAAYEGQADAIGAQLMDGAGFGGPAAMREAWKSFFGCGRIRATIGETDLGHPSPGTRWAGSLSVEKALAARKDASGETRRVLEGDPAGDAMAALFGGDERPVRPIVGLEDVTVAGAPQPGKAAMRDLSMPGAAQNAGSFAQHAAAADSYGEPGTARGAADIYCADVGSSAP